MRFIERPYVFPFVVGTALLVVATAYSVSPSAAAEPSTARPESGSVAGEKTRAQRLDALFATLKHQSNFDAAGKTAAAIWAIWNESGSPTVDLLMTWSDKAVAAKDYSRALDLLDEVTVLDPDYAEGWNRRATVHYLMNDYAKSMADIDRTLVLEPRHFGALAGMAGILAAAGKDELAMEALQRVLDIYPANRPAQEQLGQLADKVVGESL